MIRMVERAYLDWNYPFVHRRPISVTRVTLRTSASANFRLEGGGTPVAAGSSYPVART
jgi:hypothetical protein